MTAYYNEIDPYAAQWLRNLISAGHIAPGDVDERSIEDVCPEDLKAYHQCHFFAGVGVWSLALRNVGFPDDARIWTGSCPCQPFSAAGKGGGFADERHLWPAFYHLILNCEPQRVVGEQVASLDGLGWLDTVQTDMEIADYAFGAVDTCAAGFGAPHIRQRLYWMADADDDGRREHGQCLGSAPGAGERKTGEWERLRVNIAHDSAVSHVANAAVRGRQQFSNGEHEHLRVLSAPDGKTERVQQPGANSTGVFTGLANDVLQQRSITSGSCDDTGRRQQEPTTIAGLCGDLRPRPTNGLWGAADWLYCRDGKWRPVEPGTFPLAHGATSRVGRLRAYGNAITVAQATGFLTAALT